MVVVRVPVPRVHGRVHPPERFLIAARGVVRGRLERPAVGGAGGEVRLPARGDIRVEVGAHHIGELRRAVQPLALRRELRRPNKQSA